MKITVIEASEAPARPGGPMSKRTAAVTALLTSLTPGKVARIELDAGETTRGAKASLTRAAKKLGQEVAVWVRDGVVFAQLAEGERPRRRGRQAAASE